MTGLTHELTDPNVVCCFCKESLRSSLAAAIRVSAPGARQEVQELWAHPACLMERIDPSIPMHPGLWGESAGPKAGS